MPINYKENAKRLGLSEDVLRAVAFGQLYGKGKGRIMPDMLGDYGRSMDEPEAQSVDYVMIHPGEFVKVEVGNHFKLVLPDGTVLEVEQTADDFSITKDDAVVAYARPTSDHAKVNSDQPTVSGYN